MENAVSKVRYLPSSLLVFSLLYSVISMLSFSVCSRAILIYVARGFSACGVCLDTVGSCMAPNPAG